jgi:hypothetical protein
MADISSVGKVAYVYNEADDTWYPVAGATNTSEDFNWTGDHSFADGTTVDMYGPLVAAGGVNSFTSVADRNSKIANPVNGTIALVVVNNILQPQYYYNGAWRLFGNNAFLDNEKSTDYSLVLSDAGKTIRMNSSTENTVTIPLDSSVSFPIGGQVAIIQTGSGQTSISGASILGGESVTIKSKFSNKKLAAQYSQAIVVKESANTWILMGDLTS